MTYYHPLIAVPGLPARAEITAPGGLTFITSAGQRAYEPAYRAGGKSHLAPVVITGRAR